MAKISETCVTTFNKDIQLSLQQASPTPSCVCAGCFYRLRQLRRIRRSLDSDSLATLIYAVVNSRMDYCNTVLASAPTTVTDKLQRVLNAAARVITGTRKFDRGLGQILHWLDVPDRVLFKLAVTVHQCLNGRAPPCLSVHCIPVSNADTRRHLRITNRHLLAVPRFWLNTYGCLAFSVAGPIAWNSLPDIILDPTSSTDCLGVYLKCTCSRDTSASSALGVRTIMRYTNRRTHSLTPSTELYVLPGAQNTRPLSKPRADDDDKFHYMLNKLDFNM